MTYHSRSLADVKQPDPYRTLDLYMQHLAAVRRLSANTLSAYYSDIGHFLRWCEAAHRIVTADQIGQALLLDYVASQAHLSPNTIRRRTHALSGWFWYLVKRGELVSNPCDDLPLPRRERADRKCPSGREVARVLAAARTPLEKAIAYLLAGTGVRRAELIGLDLVDVAEDRSEISVLGKGSKPRRIPLPHSVREALHGYLAARGTRDGPLLLSRVGTRLGTTSLRRIFDRLIRRAGLADRGYSLHSMRHAYASSLVRAGVDLGTVRDLLGHSDLQVTSLYIHSDARTKRDAVELLEFSVRGDDNNG